VGRKKANVDRRTKEQGGRVGWGAGHERGMSIMKKKPAAGGQSVA